MRRRSAAHGLALVLLAATAEHAAAQSVARFVSSQVTYKRACPTSAGAKGAPDSDRPGVRAVTVPLTWTCHADQHSGEAAFTFAPEITLVPGTQDHWQLSAPAAMSASWSVTPTSEFGSAVRLEIAQAGGGAAPCVDAKLADPTSTVRVDLSVMKECTTWQQPITSPQRFSITYVVTSLVVYNGAQGKDARQDLLVDAIYSIPGPDLEVRLDGGRVEGQVGRSPAWAVKATNRGDQPATVVELDLELLAGETLSVSPSSACTVFGRKGGERNKAICTLGALPPGETRELFVDSTVDDENTDSTSTLKAVVSSETTDVYLPNNSAQLDQKYTSCGPRESGTCALTRGACLYLGGSHPRPLARALKALVDTFIDLDVFYRLRDEVFAGSAAGRRYTELYYTYGREVASLLATNPSLLADMLGSLLQWQPHVRALVTREGASVALVTSQQVSGLLAFLARLEALGTPELAAVIARERAAIDLPSLLGRSMDEGVARLETTAPATVTVPAAASIHGLAPAFFHSDLRVLNPPGSLFTVDVTARYRCFTGPCPAVTEKSFPVRGGELRVFEDAVVSLFGAPETAGAIELTGAVLAESRVYTPELPAPTTGSDVPGLSADQAFPEAVLLSLSKGEFRTNVGVYNPGDEDLTATVTVHAASGAKLGETTRAVGARSAVQVNDVFASAGIVGDVRDAYAVVKADGVKPLFAYATVIDNRSQDSVFVKGRNARAADPTRLTIPAAASIHGVPPAFFHSDVRVFNPSPTATVSVRATYRCFTGTCPGEDERTFPVGPREMKVLNDVVATLFAAPETAGAIDLDGEVHAESRVYTPERGEPTTGTSIPGQPRSEATTRALLLSLAHSATPGRGFRTNVGIYNPDNEPHTVTISLRRTNGSQLTAIARTVPPFQPLQVNDVFGAAGITADIPSAYAIVTGDGERSFFAYATVIDNQSQDSVFVKGRPFSAP